MFIHFNFIFLCFGCQLMKIGLHICVLLCFCISVYASLCLQVCSVFASLCFCVCKYVFLCLLVFLCLQVCFVCFSLNSKRVSNRVCKLVSNRVSNCVSNHVCKRVSNHVCNRVCNLVSNRISNCVCKLVSNRVSNRVCKLVLFCLAHTSATPTPHSTTGRLTGALASEDL